MLGSKEVKINVLGSAMVNVCDVLDAKVNGSGSVEYIGDDPTVNQDVSGVGAVRKHQSEDE